jgi:two-component system CheB/CheR fusion protein
MAGEKRDKRSRAKPKGGKPQNNAETAEEAEPRAGPPGEAQPVAPEASVPEADQTETHEWTPCPVAGVGASAGGLEALQGLFEHVPADLGVAFVVIQHRTADRTSVMRSLIEKHTRLAVKDIEDGMKIEPGTGSDGTLGLKDIKAAAGLVTAQDETQAKYDSMPRSATDTGMVDFVLPVEKMGEQLAQCITHPFLTKPKPPDVEEKNLESQFQKVFLLIRGETGHDFSHYKRNTIQRRIARRLAVHQIDNLQHYVRFLQQNPEEVKTLAKELLITVTNFFRDREAFEKLQEQVIAPLVNQKAPDSFIRVWVAGCATGEEAYSIAMMLYEEIMRTEKHFTVRVFATDIDEESVETARRGQYPKSIAGDVPPARLKRFFIEENNHYRVKSGIREMIVFATHNLTKDSPFSKLDLLCCRNVLIYMDATLQKKLIPMFHYTLNSGAFLFLGESESVGTFSDLFVAVDARHKIFKRKPVSTGYEPETEVGFYPQAEAARKDRRQVKTQRREIDAVAERVILRDYSLPCVLVGEDYNIVYFNGDVNKYLIQPGGKPTNNVVRGRTTSKDRHGAWEMEQ